MSWPREVGKPLRTTREGWFVRRSTLEFRRQGFTGAGQQSKVTAHGDHRAHLRQPMPRVVFERRKNPGRLARLANSHHGFLDRRANFRMAIITQMTERRCKVAWADEQAIHTLDSRDGLQVL